MWIAWTTKFWPNYLQARVCQQTRISRPAQESRRWPTQSSHEGGPRAYPDRLAVAGYKYIQERDGQYIEIRKMTWVGGVRLLEKWIYEKEHEWPDRKNLGRTSGKDIWLGFGGTITLLVTLCDFCYNYLLCSFLRKPYFSQVKHIW